MGCRKDADGYREEVCAELTNLYAVLTALSASGVAPSVSEAATRAETRELCELLSFAASAAAKYPKEEAMLRIPPLLTAIVSSQLHSLPPRIRRALFRCLISLRRRGVGSESADGLAALFAAFAVPDKPLRAMLQSHIVSAALSLKGAAAVATRGMIGSFLYAALAGSDVAAAERAIVILTALYARGAAWRGPRAANAIARCCFSGHRKVQLAALRFMLGQLTGHAAAAAADDAADEAEAAAQVQRDIFAASKLHRGAHKTRKRAADKKATAQRAKRKGGRLERDREEDAKRRGFSPIDHLADADGFVERMCAEVRRAKSFATKLLMMAVISQTIAAHDVVYLPWYDVIQRYLEPHIPQCTVILALAAQSVHALVPPDTGASLVRAIANAFVSERSPPDAAATGVSAIREVFKRLPHAATPELAAELTALRHRKAGDRGAAMAARSLLALLRKTNTAVLPKKEVGRGGKAAVPPAWGAPQGVTEIPGIEALADRRDAWEGLAAGEEEGAVGAASVRDELETYVADAADVPPTPETMSDAEPSPDADAEEGDDGDDDEGEEGEGGGEDGSDGDSSGGWEEVEDDDDGGEGGGDTSADESDDPEPPRRRRRVADTPTPTPTPTPLTAGQLVAATGSDAKSAAAASASSSAASAMSLASTHFLSDIGARAIRAAQQAQRAEGSRYLRGTRAAQARFKDRAAAKAPLPHAAAGVAVAPRVLETDTRKRRREDDAVVEAERAAKKRRNSLTARRLRKGGGSTNAQKRRRIASRLTQSSARKQSARLQSASAKASRAVEQARATRKFLVRRGIGV